MLSTLAPSCLISIAGGKPRNATSYQRCSREPRAASFTRRRSERLKPSATAVVAAAADAASRSSSSSSPSPWLCPACSSALCFSEDFKTFSCPQNHCFDVAREGYVNLVRTGRKAKKSGAAPAGDAPEALAARGRFFAAGHFDRVMDAAADAVMEVLQRSGAGEGEGSGATVLDAGCGEGAYLRRLSRRLLASSSPLLSSISLLSVDVSKAAVRFAASRAQREEQEGEKVTAHFAVASAFALPLADASVSCALVAFAPLPSAELRRVLKDGSEPGAASSAAVVVVGPGPEHFLGLKREVYGAERAERGKGGEGGEEEEGDDEEGSSPSAGALPPFSSQARVQYRLSLDGPSALDLLRMTPYWWKASDETRGKVGNEGLETEVDVLVSVVERAELDLL